MWEMKREDEDDEVRGKYRDRKGSCDGGFESITATKKAYIGKTC